MRRFAVVVSVALLCVTWACSDSLNPDDFSKIVTVTLASPVSTSDSPCAPHSYRFQTVEGYLAGGSHNGEYLFANALYPDMVPFSPQIRDKWFARAWYGRSGVTSEDVIEFFLQMRPCGDATNREHSWEYVHYGIQSSSGTEALAGEGKASAVGKLEVLPSKNRAEKGFTSYYLAFSRSDGQKVTALCFKMAAGVRVRSTCKVSSAYRTDSTLTYHIPESLGQQLPLIDAKIIALLDAWRIKGP